MLCNGYGCSKEAESGFKNCTECKKRNKEKSEKSRKNKIQRGLCGQCSKPRSNDPSLCDSCREKKRKLDSNRVAEFKQLGLCSCGNSLKGLTTESCSNCLEKSIKRNKINKLKVINHYSSNTKKCACPYCNESDPNFLSINHINGGGSKHRKQISGKSGKGGGGSHMNKWLIRNNMPAGVNIQCFNCNAGTEFNLGVCPHIQLKPIISYYHKIKEKVFQHYGNKCACCGENNRGFLSIDHINGNGANHREELKKKGLKLVEWLLIENFPPGFQLLCFNCNQSKKNKNQCWHQISRISQGLSQIATPVVQSQPKIRCITCSRDADFNFSNCSVCRNSGKKRPPTARKKRFDAGICRYCTNPRLPEIASCSICREKKKEENKLQREKRRNSGKCNYCSNDVTNLETTTCSDCLEKYKTYKKIGKTRK